MFLDYGSTDSSVIVQEPLTSGSGILSEIGSPSYGSDGVVLSQNDGLGIDLSAHDITNGFQIQFEVDTASISDVNLPYNALGTTRVATEFMCSFGNAQVPTGSNYGRFYIADSNSFFMRVNNGDGLPYPANKATTHGATAKKIIYITIDRNTLKSAVLLNRNSQIEDADFTDYTGMLNYFWLGCDRGNNGTSFLGSAIKNLQIATIPITQVDKLGGAFAGDSFMNLGRWSAYPPDTVGAPRYHQRVDNIIEAEYRNTYDYTRKPQNFGSGGAAVTGTLPGLWATMLAENSFPYIVSQMGTNDATQGNLLDIGLFETNIKQMITDAMAIPRISFIIMGNVPTTKANSSYDGAQYVSSVAAINAVYASLTGWWASVGNGKPLVIVDVFTALGSESPRTDATSQFEGFQNTPYQNDLHESSDGMSIRTRLYFDEIKKLEGRIVPTFGQPDITGGALLPVLNSPRAIQADGIPANVNHAGQPKYLNVTAPITMTSGRVYGESAGPDTPASTFTIAVYAGYLEGSSNAYEPVGNKLATSSPSADVSTAGWYDVAFANEEITPAAILAQGGEDGVIVLVVQNSGADNTLTFYNSTIASLPATPFTGQNVNGITDPWARTQAFTLYDPAVEATYLIPEPVLPSPGSEPVPTTPRQADMVLVSNGVGGISKYTYLNESIAEAAVNAADFWAGVRKYNLKTNDIIDCVLSDGVFKVRMTSATTSESV